MIITLIAAMDKNRGIGFNNTIPWMGKVPSDMKHFRQMTIGHPVIMGRNTYASMGGALPKRANIILSSSPTFTAPNAQIAHSLPEAFALAQNEEGSEEVFVIGGAQLYASALSYATRLILTEIDDTFPADTYFPMFDASDWTLEDEHSIPKNNRDQFAMRIITWKRKTA